MTTEQRRQARDALWHWELLERAADGESGLWLHAIRRTAAYYEGLDPIRAGIIELRYRRHLTEERTREALHIGHSTYRKGVDDILSTLAVYAAQLGLP